MRTLILAGWLLLPVGFGIWHYGPGQERVQLDDIAKKLAEADRCVANEDWTQAVEWYEEALKNLPEDRVVEGQRIRLEKAKAQMKCGLLPEAYGDLNNLCEQLQAKESDQPKLLAETRSALAQAHYYMTWLMRLEGEPRDSWEPEIETARQNYRLLAEQAAKAGNELEAKKHTEDLEASVRLARMELSELQGLSLPCQCCNCKGKCKSNKKSMQKKTGPKDARGASSGPPPDGAGH